MAFAAFAEHNRLDQRGPAQIIDVIKRRFGGDQRSDDFVVAKVCGGDQCGPLIGAGDVGGLAAARKRGF
jgi:hypothetical protein